MKKLLRSARLNLILALACASLAAQQVGQQVPEHAPDGGIVQHVESIDIPAIANAPFSAVVVTELTNIMPDGSKRTVGNHRLVARDSSGRVFQERRFFSPTGQTEATPLSELDYIDPGQHERYVCSPTRTCRLFTYNSRFVPPENAGSLPAVTNLPNGVTIQREDLGRNVIEDVDVLGSREITTVPAAMIGSQKPQPVVKEFWYAPRLGINLVTKRFDPRVSAIQNFNVTQLNLSEPDPKLFTPPADYRIIRMDP